MDYSEQGKKSLIEKQVLYLSIVTGRVWWDEVTATKNYILCFLRSRLMICSDLLKDRNFIQLIQ